ncbi:MAG TPA: AAA family ATPase, partial [Caulobacteraceae bacterium]|nr:AAA family ATPase [Caulobacteraceae bacterium]
MPRTVLRRITLTDFRSYERVELALEGRPVFLAGPNGAGKTNLLEAISLLIPGRGLRNASLGEIGRHEPSEDQGRAWAVAAEVEVADGIVRLGTGLETPDAARRSVRVDGEPVAAGRLADILRLVWL